MPAFMAVQLMDGDSVRSGVWAGVKLLEGVLHAQGTQLTGAALPAREVLDTEGEADTELQEDGSCLFFCALLS